MSKYHTHSGPFLLRHRPLSRYCCYDALIDECCKRIQACNVFVQNDDILNI